MPRYDDEERLTVRDALALLTVEDLKPLAKLVGEPPARKGELVELLARTMTDAARVRSLYDRLDDIGKKAVQEATHDAAGRLIDGKFTAKYGRAPDFGSSGRRYGSSGKPTALRLFFPRCRTLPTDLRTTLQAFVPEPPPMTVAVSEELPTEVRRPHLEQGSYYKPDEEPVALRVRQTSRAALHDVKAVLRLVDAGSVKVSDKTRRPSQATMKAVAAVLQEGDFYADSDASDDSWGPASDLTMQAFAWPMLVQAGGLAELAGSRLRLTAAGRKATTAPAQEVLRQLWQRWQKSTLVDEFNRVDAIKGQQSRGSLTAVAPRRSAVVEVLEQCPVGPWIAVEEIFRLLKVEVPDLRVAQDEWRLYIAEHQYGSLGYDGRYTWEILQGRFVLAFLFEYGATLGLLDVAYIEPDGARNDYYDRWGSDDLGCLSRYDGLLFIRINRLGAWCLGSANAFVPEAVPVAQVLKVLANSDVVATEQAPSAADALFLERFAERRSEKVWRLTREKILEAVEQGMSLGELREFLAAKSGAALPQTIDVFLADLEDKTGQLEDAGAARLITCKDAVVARTLAHDRRLGRLVRIAGDRDLVFRSGDEPAVRRALRERGYVLPPPR